MDYDLRFGCAAIATMDDDGWTGMDDDADGWMTKIKDKNHNIHYILLWKWKSYHISHNTSGPAKSASSSTLSCGGLGIASPGLFPRQNYWHFLEALG